MPMLSAFDQSGQSEFGLGTVSALLAQKTEHGPEHFPLAAASQSARL